MLDKSVLPTMKDTAAVTGMTAQVSPIVGVYTASVSPTMKPPPTNVAAGSKVWCSMLQGHYHSILRFAHTLVEEFGS